MQDWRNYLLAVLGTWIATSFLTGRWAQKREDHEDTANKNYDQLERRVVRLETTMTEMVTLRYQIEHMRASIDTRLDTANTESSRLTGMVQTLIGAVAQLNIRAEKLDTWVCDLRNEGK